METAFDYPQSSHLPGQTPWQRFKGLVRAQVSRQLNNMFPLCLETTSLRTLFAKFPVKALLAMVKFNCEEEEAT
jgi:hypothetical protein